MVFLLLTLNIFHSGLSMNILRAANKLPMQKSFFKKSTDDLLPALSFRGGLYNFYNFVIIFSLCNYIFFNVSHDDM